MKGFWYLATIITMAYKVAGNDKNENIGNSILICKLKSLRDSSELVYDKNEDYDPDSAFDSNLNQKNVIHMEEYPVNDEIVLRKKKHKHGDSESLGLTSSSETDSDTKESKKKDLSTSSSGSTETDNEKKKSKHKKKKKKHKKHVVIWYTTPTAIGFNAFPQYLDWSTNNPLYQTDMFGRTIFPTDSHGWPIIPAWAQSSVSYHKPYPTKAATDAWGDTIVSYHKPYPTKPVTDGWGHSIVSYHKPYPTQKYGAVAPGNLKLLRILK